MTQVRLQEFLEMLSPLLDKLISFSSNASVDSEGAGVLLSHLAFVTVIYDDWYGLRTPIGIVHEVTFTNGQTREVFTFCGKAEKQPGMALFVKKRNGNLATGLVLSHEDMDCVPSFLKTLPTEYKDAHFAGKCSVPEMLAC